MNLTIELPDESATRLQKQAAARGVTVEELMQELARERAQQDVELAGQLQAQAAVARILEIQKRVKPDPEGWTIRDYINRGRR